MSKPIDDLIQVLEILKPYVGDKYFTGCEHDIMYFYVNPEEVKEEDVIKLDELGVFVDDDIECFSSYKFGSA